MTPAGSVRITGEKMMLFTYARVNSNEKIQERKKK